MGYNVYSNCGIGLAGGTNPGITRTHNVDGWRAPNQPDPLPCCEPQQVRSWELENLLNGMQTVIDPLLTSIDSKTESRTKALQVLIALNEGKFDVSEISDKGSYNGALALSALWSTVTGIIKDNNKYLFVQGYQTSGTLTNAPYLIGKSDLTGTYIAALPCKWYLIEPDMYDSTDWAYVQFFSNTHINWLYFDPANFVI